MAVEDQDDLLPLALADQPVQEVDEHRGHEFVLEHPELQAPLVGDRRDHVRAEALAGALDEGSLADRAPRSSGAVIGAQPHLIDPQDQGLLAVGARLDLRVALIQPARDQLRVLLERPACGLLRGEPPAAQIAPRGLLGDPDVKAPLDQLTHQRPGPQEPRQLELVGVLLTNRLGDLRLLPWQQSRLLTRTSATRACPQRLLTSEPLRPHPLAHRLAAHIDQSGRFGLRATLTDQPYGAPSQLLLSRRRQPSRIPRSHTQKPTKFVGRLVARSSRSAARSFLSARGLADLLVPLGR